MNQVLWGGSDQLLAHQTLAKDRAYLLKGFVTFAPPLFQARVDYFRFLHVFLVLILFAKGNELLDLYLRDKHQSLRILLRQRQDSRLFSLTYSSCSLSGQGSNADLLEDLLPLPSALRA